MSTAARGGGRRKGAEGQGLGRRGGKYEGGDEEGQRQGGRDETGDGGEGPGGGHHRVPRRPVPSPPPAAMRAFSGPRVGEICSRPRIATHL